MKFWKKILRPESVDVSDQLRSKYESFRRLLTTNNEILRDITELEGTLTGEKEVTLDEIRALTDALKGRVASMVDDSTCWRRDTISIFVTSSRKSPVESRTNTGRFMAGPLRVCASLWRNRT